MLEQDKELSIVRIKPTLLSLFPSNLRKLGIHDCVRFIEMYVRGYVIYILMKNTVEIGYCVISRGGRRYPFSQGIGVIVGPYYVTPQERGNQFASRLLEHVIEDAYFGELRSYYAFVHKKNASSIKTLIKSSFVFIGEVKYTKLLRVLKIAGNSDGDYFLYKKN